MSRFSIKVVAAAVLACFTLVVTADVSACCHHRRRCGGGGGGYGGCGGYGGGCGYGGGGYCYSGYGYGGYYAAMPAPLFPRLAYLGHGRFVAPPVVVTAASYSAPVAVPAVVRVSSARANQNLALSTAGTPNAISPNGGGNQ